ncbi:NADP-dependent oxidoreductase [Nocardioides kongjuensis]|uniref:NADPH2:quinone reductase n=1 Tax=Nocardioides kongjuensis TaxID=349522 RepID=A0A852RRN8_9ACTN|nr:NADP-dependent oxidoreductase [Nocardioides kongjuensis]NYD30604.1 NADPH2:quinone reductase [Nocardioides kongjuensis]
MFAMIMNETGGPEVLQYGEIETPEPGPGEVRVRVAYAGVNPADWKNRQGMLAAFRPYVFPYVLGFDAAGVVDALGEGVTGFAVGDRVVTPTNHGQGAQGSYAEYVVANVDRVAPVPEAMGFAEAAALPVAALTAWQALQHNGGVQPGQRVLVHGGSGGLGSFAVQFARAAGAEVAATCSTGNVAYLRGLGVDRVIDYVTEDVTAAVKEWAPDGLDLLVNTAGASSLAHGLDLVRDGGAFVSIPTLVDDGDIPADVAAAAGRGIERVYSMMTDIDCAPALATIAGLVVSGEVRLPEIRELDLREAAAAHEAIQTGHTRGKIVLKVADL